MRQSEIDKYKAEGNWNYVWDMPIRLHEPSKPRNSHSDGLPKFPGERKRKK